MTVVRTIAECRAVRGRLSGLGLVPTMGALHAGHSSLILAARQHARATAVSIFVNPTQFGPREDLARYPRSLEQDLALCREAGVDLVFAPDTTDMYADQTKVLVDLPDLTSVLEGKHRPGHFQGVCQIVTKLFNVMQPQSAYFGRKDFQQLRVVEAMVDALNVPVTIVGCPTVREYDGLAMSSRNRALTPDQHARALSISRALFAAMEAFDGGSRLASRLVTIMQRTLLDVGQLGHVPLSIDYVACVDPKTLRPLEQITDTAVCCIAARVGDTRLIDNLMLTV